MRFIQTWNFAMFENFIHSPLRLRMQKTMCGNSGTVETYFLSPNRCETQITKNIKTSKYTFFTVV